MKHFSFFFHNYVPDTVSETEQNNFRMYYHFFCHFYSNSIEYYQPFYCRL